MCAHGYAHVYVYDYVCACASVHAHVRVYVWGYAKAHFTCTLCIYGPACACLYTCMIMFMFHTCNMKSTAVCLKIKREGGFHKFEAGMQEVSYCGVGGGDVS